MRKIYGSPLFKLLTVVLLAVTIPASLWCGYGMVFFGEGLLAKNLSFADSKAALKLSEGYAEEIVAVWFEGALVERQPYYKDQTNIEFALRDYDRDNDLYNLIIFSGHVYQWKKDYYYHYSDGKLKLSDSENLVKKADKAEKSGDYGKVSIYLDETLAVNDNYAEEYKKFEILAPFRRLFIPVGLAVFAALAAVLAMIYSSAGISRKSDQLKLFKIDRLLFEVLLLLLVSVTFLHYSIASKSVFSAYADETSRIICAIVLILSETSFIYAVLASLARRIKTKTFLNTSLLGHFICLFKMIPMKATVIFAAIMYMILLVYASSKPWLSILCGGILIFGVLIMLANGRQLSYASAKLADGNLDYRIKEDDLDKMLWFFRKHGEQLNSIADGLNDAVEKQMKSERMKTELITNVSHDIKTPLTSIINYVNLLKDDHTEEQEKEYIEVLSRNSERLKNLTEDIVEASKAATGNISVEPEKTNVLELTEQALAEFEQKLSDAKLTPVVRISEDLNVMADGKLLWRIISNLLSNCVKYSMPGTRVYIEAAKTEDNTAVISFKNISREQLNISADELIERFVRGDQARSTEGSGLGLHIAKSLAVLQHGDLHLTIDGDYFKAVVEIPLC